MRKARSITDHPSSPVNHHLCALQVDHTSVCFLNCHLAAHQDKTVCSRSHIPLSRRTHSCIHAPFRSRATTTFARSSRPQRYFKNTSAAHVQTQQVELRLTPAFCSSLQVGRQYTEAGYIDILNQFDHLVWMGDLNYRVNFGSQGNSKRCACPCLHAASSSLIDLLCVSRSP